MPFPLYEPSPNRSWYTSETAKAYGSMPLGTGEDALEERSVTAGRQRRRDSRLQHGVPLDHAAAARIEPRTVERMRHLPDQALGRSPRESRVGVERDHVADAGRRDGQAAVDWRRRWCRSRRAAIDSARAASRACAPTRSTCPLPRSRPAGDGGGGSGRRPAPRRSADSAARCPSAAAPSSSSSPGAVSVAESVQSESSAKRRSPS